MIIDCAHYHDGRRRDEGPVPLNEAAARCGQGGFVWLGLLEPGEDELAQVRDTFGLHELAVEDAQNFHMRPKSKATSRTYSWSSCAPRATTTIRRKSSSARSASSSPRRS